MNCQNLLLPLPAIQRINVMRKRFLGCIVMLLIDIGGAMIQADNLGTMLTDGLEYELSVQGGITRGDHTPLWLNANKYGLSSLNKDNGYLRASITKPMATESNRKWEIGYKLDMVAAYHHTSTMIVQQAFVEARWLKGYLTIGAKEYPLELKNDELSTGSQTLGKNARPVPLVRLALPDYWAVPLTNGWVSVKGHIAYGMQTDGNWQADFTHQQSKYTDKTLYHSKAGYIKIGNEYRFLPVSVEMGLEMAAQFGGTSWIPGLGGEMGKVENSQGISDFWNVFIPGGSDVGEDVYKNREGNQVGSWVLRINFDYPTWYMGIYADHYFEDQSSMFMVDYDGYGKGDEWDTRKHNRIMMYSLKDMQLGLDLKFKNSNALNNILFEYIYSKYQSGPVYHDHTQTVSDHIGGNDDYYNHSIFSGWQHWGQVMGNPLYLSPIYNDDATIKVKDNRFYAFHLALAGDPSQYTHYKVMATYRKGFGTYDKPLFNPKESLSVMAQLDYSFPDYTKMKGWGITAAYGWDAGNTYGQNHGFMLTIRKSGKL